MDDAARFAVVASAEPLAVGDSLNASQGPLHVVLAPTFYASPTARENLTTAIRRSAVVGQPVTLHSQTGDPTPLSRPDFLRNADHLRAMHRRLAFQLEVLDGLVIEQPEQWRDGYRPLLTGPLEKQRAREDLEVSCIAVLELQNQNAVVRVVLDLPIAAPFDRPVLLVAVPVGSDPTALEVVAGTEDLGTSTFLAVETTDGLRLATARQPGIRYRNGQLLGTDLHLADTARQAVFQVLAEQLPIDVDSTEEELQAQTDWLQQESERIASQVWDPSVWTTRPVLVDGATFALFATTLNDSIAAVLDLGYARVTITGPDLLRDLTLTLIPANSLRWK